MRPVCAVLVGGGDIDTEFAAGLIGDLKESYNVKYIVQDGGLRAAAALDIVPDLLIGDMDTIGAECACGYAAREHVAIKKLDPVKDDTDSEAAMDAAIVLLNEQGRDPEADCVVMIGALGGRFDHSLGNVHVMLKAMKAGVRAYITDSLNRMHIVKPCSEETILRAGQFGEYISFIPLTGNVTGLTLRGFKYPVQDIVLEPGNTLGVSNELSCDAGTVYYETGYLLCVESKDRQ